MNLPAWYHGSREEFLEASKITIANQLAGRAAAESLEIESSQSDEWHRSIGLLQRTLDKRIPILRNVLQSDSGHWIRHVILEFDFRRRGLRMDCLFLGDGVIFVIEFKRSKVQAADRDQVITYAVNLLEFHSATRLLTENNEAVIVVPVLTLTEGKSSAPITWPGLGGHSWSSMTRTPIECDGDGLETVLKLCFENRLSNKVIPPLEWLMSPFSPSSSILDATLSLYGNHDVSAIKEHAAPRAQIEASVEEIREMVSGVLERGEYHVIFLSGAPGAGKTLVGLDLVMRGTNADRSVFVTGNAPLVEVLNEALRKSYKSQGHNGSTWAQTGYHRKNAALVASAATYKIVKAHNFLGKRGKAHRQKDGRVLVFDEAQRTYERGKTVLGEKLADHEADLILDAQKSDYPDGGAVVIALIGHNQAINRGERGILAWLEAVEQKDWSFSIADKTLESSEITDPEKWAKHPKRTVLQNGHLRQSMRYYRNAKVEEWVDALLTGNTDTANTLSNELEKHGNTVWVTRNLNRARYWAKSRTIGNQRAGLIASGQARRLAAEGLFVDYKPDIATWMLAPSTDVRSSNALETVQNQYQVQGLELDHCIVCWDADLRREAGQWAAYKLSGSEWKRDKLIDVALNSYRVLLTRARKGMVVFVPTGDLTGSDKTRCVDFYDCVWQFLLSCGARELDSES